jgi:hypothetical protein
MLLYYQIELPFIFQAVHHNFAKKKNPHDLNMVYKLVLLSEKTVFSRILNTEIICLSKNNSIEL